MAAARVQMTMPRTGLPRLATAMPATSRPSIRASLCAPPMRCRSVIGLRTAGPTTDTIIKRPPCQPQRKKARSVPKRQNPAPMNRKSPVKAGSLSFVLNRRSSKVIWFSRNHFRVSGKKKRMPTAPVITLARKPNSNTIKRMASSAVAERSRGLVPSAERAPEVRHIPGVGLGVEILFAIRDGEL